MKKKQKKSNVNVLNVAAIIVVIIAVIAVAFKLGSKNGDTEEVVSSTPQVTESNSIIPEATGSDSITPEVTDNKIVVDANTLSENVTFFDYNSNGIDMQFMLLKTDDGRVRGALNTCQVCNGSPYAYFEQVGDAVMCQNCGNQFALTQIGDEQGGCNPVPLEFTQEGDNIVINTAVLDSYAAAFTNWKKGI